MKTDLVVAGYTVHKGRVLLIHHRKSNLWLPPGGHIDENEVPDDALLREIKEELNLDVEIVDMGDAPKKTNVLRHLALPFHVNVHRAGDHNHCCFYYLCSVKEPAIKHNKLEVKDFMWFSPEDLDNELVPPDVKDIALKALELSAKFQ